MGIIDYRDESKKGYGRHVNNDEKINLSHEELQTGALLRIADAVEIVSDDYVKLKKRNKFLEDQNKYLNNELSHAHNRIRSYKGQITKLKNSQ